jgi:lipid-A-disaccharide synthase
MATRFFILAGEASGDQHAAKLMAAIVARAPDTVFAGMGGPKMAAAGLAVAKDLDGMQVTGFWEVAKQYGFFKRVFYQLLDRVKQENPAALICVDYPGFNLRFAREVRKLGIPVLYYIVPQVWAWKAMRARNMAAFVDRCYCVFDFEPPFFNRFGLKAQFVGHPLIDERKDTDCAQTRALLVPSGTGAVIGLFPGSRDNELRHHLRPMIGAVAGTGIGWLKFSSETSRHWLAEAETISGLRRPMRPPTGFHRDLAAVWKHGDAIDPLEVAGAERPPCSLSDLAAAADYNIVKSGTSTLEAGLTGTPMCVVYKSSTISYAIARLLVNIPVVSLVNIVLGRYAVPELLQGEVTAERLAREVARGIQDQAYREKQREILSELPKKLGGPGASGRAAEAMLNFLKGRE